MHVFLGRRQLPRLRAEGGCMKIKLLDVVGFLSCALWFALACAWVVT